MICRPHKHLFGIIALVAAVAAGTIPAAAQSTVPTAPTASGPVIYRLDKESTFQRGCFAPCLCPVMEQAPMRGTFILGGGVYDGLFTTYKVSDVNWVVTLNGTDVRITGGGTYRIGGEFAVQQELALDLQVGDDPVQKFDSGLITGSKVPFPAISLTISIHGQTCFDTVLNVSASPVPPDQIHPYRLLDGTTFQRGCFGACACALGPKQPVIGTFSLVDLETNSLFTEFAVVNVRWLVTSTSSTTASGLPIRGFGTYRFGGEFALQQRLSLDLLVGTEPLTHYDSGLQSGVAFPRIDSLISINGGVCFDTLIDMHAAPRRSTTVRPSLMEP